LIHPTAFIAPGAVVVGDVSLGRESSVWYNAVLRGDNAPITIGDQTNIQDLMMIHVDDRVPCTIGNRVAVGHRAVLHGCTVEDRINRSWAHYVQQAQEHRSGAFPLSL
jgi:carbonic anhydrase/acetyltransferase-like protein (isoleucine patch superfamily)